MTPEQFTTYKGVQIWTFESLCESGLRTIYYGCTLGVNDARLLVTAQSYLSLVDCANKIMATFDEAQKGILEKSEKK